VNSPASSLDEIRREIDRIDDAILQLLERRASLALHAKREKDRLGLPIQDPGREARVIERAVENCRGPLGTENVRRIFAAIVAACVNVQTAAGDLGTEVR